MTLSHPSPTLSLAIPVPRLALTLAFLALLVAGSATLALADEAPADVAPGDVAPADEAAAETEEPASAEAEVPPTAGQVFVGAVLGLVLVGGIGCLVGLLRVMFAGLATAADASARRLGTGRMLLTGVLPIVGAALLGMAAEATGSEVVQGVLAVVLGLPLMVLMLVGALGVIPHLGSRLMKAGDERSPLARCVMGTLVLVLAFAALAWAVKPIAPVVAVLVAAWFLGAGLGTIFKSKALPENGTPT